MRLGRSLILVLFFTLIWTPTSGAQVRIEGFANDLGPSTDDDAIELRNLGATAVSLSEWTVSDNVGRIGFPPDAFIPPLGSLVLAETGSAFEEAAGRAPDLSLDADDPQVRLQKVSGSFALAKDGDTLTLRHGDAVIDVVRFGDTATAGEGWRGLPVPLAGGTFLRWFQRSGPDTNTSSDWTGLRRAHVGDLLQEPMLFTGARTVVPYTAPEQSRAMVTTTLSAAQHSIRINVYQFRDRLLADDVAALLGSRPGLTVDVLLDEAPVGESREELSERGHVIQTLQDAGATVRFLPHYRYAYDHAKYVVVDEEVLLVQTENFVESGIPTDARSGNRGWGVLVGGSDVAAAAARLFDADSAERRFGARPPDASEEPDYPPLIVSSPTARASVPALEPWTGPANVTFLATPFRGAGEADPIAQAIAASTTEIVIEQLDFAPNWRTPEGDYVTHPYLVALREAANRGVRVRMLLDGHFLDDPGAKGSNEDTVRAVAGSPRIEARLQEDPRPVLHAKGMVIDRRLALVGSMNWNSNSLLQNREVGLLLEEPRVAAFFQRIFEQDWEAANPDAIPAPSVATVLTLAGLGLFLQGRRRP